MPNDLWTYITEGGIGAVLLFVIWKYGVPVVKKLYGELVELRGENSELKTKIAGIEAKLLYTEEKLDYFKSKYTDKVVLKSHGKKTSDG